MRVAQRMRNLRINWRQRGHEKLEWLNRADLTWAIGWKKWSIRTDREEWHSLYEARRTFVQLDS